MKLLIVDDQRATLKGLADNIPWQEDGFDVVDTAANAMEARLSFGRGRPEVMMTIAESAASSYWPERTMAGAPKEVPW